MKRTRCLIGLGVLWCLLQSVQAQTDPLAAGKAAFEAGQYAEALARLETVGTKDPGYPEAQYYLARLYLVPGWLDPDKSKKAIKEALKRDPDNLRYQEVELWRRYFHPSSFLPYYQARKRIGLAEDILERDPDNAIAHFVLGAWSYQGFREQYHGVQFSSPAGHRALLTAEDDLLTDAAFLLEPRIDDTGAGRRVSFVDAYYTGFTVPVTSRREAGLAAYREAVAHLRRAIAARPGWFEAYRLVLAAMALRGDYDAAAGVLDTLRQHLPERPEAWLYTGYFAWRADRAEEADEAFDRALMLLSPDERRPYEDIAYFLPQVEQVWYEADRAGYSRGYWERHDPRLLTPVNERRLEHLARMVYADLRFGRPEEGVHGWETEPGQVIVRYGEPRAEARYGSSTDEYLVFHYGDLYFKFMDIVRSGYFTFYSPPALDFAGFRPQRGVIENDFAVRGPETFRKVPDRYTLEEPGRVPVPFTVSTFRGEAGATDVYVAYGVPREGAGPTVRTGVFLLGKKGRVAAAEQRLNMALDGTADVQPDVVRLTAPPGAYELAVEFEQVPPGPPLGYERMQVRAPHFDGERLQLSDLLLAYGVEEAGDEEPSPGTFVRHGLIFRPAPGARFARTRPIYFYYEVYGLRPDASGEARYTVEAVLVRGEDPDDVDGLLEKLFGRDRGAAVSVRFEGRVAGNEDGHYLILDASREEPGPHVLAIRLTDPQQGRTVERRRVLYLE